MVMQVPKKYQSDEGIRAIFESVQVPYPTTSVHIGRKVGRLSELIELHNDTVKDLESVLVKYMKDGKIAKERPMKRLGGFMCFGGQKVDAIDFYTYVAHYLTLNSNNGENILSVQSSSEPKERSRSIVIKLTPINLKTMVSHPWHQCHMRILSAICLGRNESKAPVLH